MKTCIIGAVTSGVLALGVVPAVAAVDPLPSTDALSPAQIHRVGDKYLRIVCREGPAMKRVRRDEARAFPNPRKVLIGTRAPSYLRKSYRRAANAMAKQGMLLNRSRWPEDLVGDINQIVRADFRAVNYFEARDTATVRRNWERAFPSYGNAALRIRVALLLPPPGRGC